MNFKILNIACSVIFFTFVIACNKKSESVFGGEGQSFEVFSFHPIVNWGDENDTIKEIGIEWNEINEGIEIPTKNQIESGYFKFTFEIKNKGNVPASFYYKIYYQNSSYKYPIRPDSSFEYFNSQSDNFYGSWEDTTIGIKQTSVIPADDEYHLISDSFRIVGNPRFESRYMENGINQPWKRNPRMGNYEFMLLVIDEESKNNKSIPEQVLYLNKKSQEYFINPFDYLTQRVSDPLNGICNITSTSVLKVKATIDFSKGIYVNPNSYNSTSDQKFLCLTCNSNENLKNNACVEQFIPTIISDTYLKNIPVIADVNSNEYNREDYYWNKSFTALEERIYTIPTRPRSACESVRYNEKDKSIELRNPSSKPFDWRKEISGIKTRHGLTYGKYRVKCKLTRLLNDSNMWNGITNAIWLITQSEEPWNHLKPCKNGGYMSDYVGDENSARKELSGYSEIDFEIIKAHPYCPLNSFPPFFRRTTPNKNRKTDWLPRPTKDLSDDEDKILVACTNWDMACQDPNKQAGGCVTLVHNNKKSSSFRWGKSSRATTGGQLAIDRDLFGKDYYYFEIEWSPTEIIWKIGPEANQMQEICYMDSSFTSIPNNQMLLIIDQEFHNTKWWFGAPFEQENIPFPSKEIIGKIYEITIE